jgi:D-3-phosphoglycerate dehydrogenase
MKILVSDKLSERGLKILKDTKGFDVQMKTGLKPQELKKIIKDYDALIVRSATNVTRDIIEAADKLKIIGRAGVGLDNVDLKAATAKGIIVMNTPGGNTISTAEHAMSLLLSLSRNIPQANQTTKKGEWLRSKFMGVELYSKVLGIIGLGRVGKEVAKRAAAFGMKILAFDPFLSEEVAKALEVEIVELKDLLNRSDYITIHTPLTDETKHMISDEEFSLMKKTCRIINCARGGIIDEEALIRAIKAGKINAAALDVFEKEPVDKNSPLLKLDNVIVTCHLGASTEEAQVNVAVEIAQCLRDALLGRGIRNAANYPSLEPEAYKILEPYINLTEKLGEFCIQLTEGRLLEVKISYSGEIIRHDTGPLTMALVKGILVPILKENVNFINAISLAKDRGVKIQEVKYSKEEEFVTLVSVQIKTNKQVRKVAGTLSPNRQPRIVKIDEFYVEATPFGYMIVVENWDRPGIIGNLGTLLGSCNINIAAMTFGREKPKGKTISVLNVDSPISDELLKKIQKIDNILSVKVIKL